MPKRIITLQLEIKDPLLRAFFFGSICQRTPDGYMVSTLTITGAVICALAEAVNSPSATKGTINTVSVLLPSSNINSRLLGRFLYLHPDNATKVRLVLKREFNLAFSSNLFLGLSSGLSRKKTIELFIAQYNLDDIPTAFETLNKKRQRNTEANVRHLTNRLQHLALYQVRKVIKPHSNDM